MDTGKVGIGTTNPGALLDLTGATASSSPKLRFTGTGEASAGDVIGNIEFVSNEKLVLSTPLIAIESIEAKGFFGRIWARIVFWIMSLFSIGK